MMLERRAWNWIDKALFGIYTSWFALGAAIFATKPLPAEAARVSLPFILISLTLCYLLPLASWRPGYVHRTFFPLTVLLTGGILELYISHQAHVQVGLLMIPILLIGYMANRYNIWWTFPLFVLGIPLVSVLISNFKYPVGTFLNEAGLYGLFFALGFGLERGLESHRRMKRLLEENIRQYKLIQEQNSALEQYAKQIEQVTLLEERNRLARELHDTVGHTFTSVIMGMDAVAYLLEMAPDKARDKLDVLRDVTRKGLEEVRRSIHQIAPNDTSDPLSLQIARLANEFAVHTGTNVRVSVQGDEVELPKQAQLTFIRCLQESLTNAKRHGQARLVETTLEYTADQVELRVQDDGIGSDGLERGFGLTAMKERISALQGSLQVESKPGLGTYVRCTVPIQR